MKKKLILYISILISILVIFSTIISYVKTYDVYKEQTKGYISKQALLINEALMNINDFQVLEQRIRDYSDDLSIRITLINSNGQVLIDSEHDPTEMDNHSNRPEVIQAKRDGEGSSIRYSATSGFDYLYVAQRIENPLIDGGILRLSLPLSYIKEIGMEMIKLTTMAVLIGSLLIVIVLSIIINQFMDPLDQLTKAAITISKGNYRMPVIIHGDKQINRLADAFEDMRVELKRNISKLKQRNDELELILKSMVNGVIAIDYDFKIMFSNDAFYKLFDLEQHNDSSSLYEIIRMSQLYDILYDVLSTGQPIQERIVLDNAAKTYMVIGNPINFRGKTIGCLLIIQDITKRIRLENMRSDFVSNVTHELKTPLTSIRGFVETLRQGALHDEKVANRFLEIIDIEAERLTTLIEDILELSEIENKNIDSRQLMNLKPMIEEIIPLLNEKAIKKHLLLEYTIDNGLPLFYCNGHRIKQLIINLIDNAIKYTEKGSVKLNIRHINIRNVIEITVRDTGIGITEKEINRIFERFYRVDKSRSRKMGGTGLGLSIVKHIVELYGGKIDVRSKVGEGSQFTITLPIINKS